MKIAAGINISAPTRSEKSMVDILIKPHTGTMFYKKVTKNLFKVLKVALWKTSNKGLIDHWEMAHVFMLNVYLFKFLELLINQKIEQNLKKEKTT